MQSSQSQFMFHRHERKRYKRSKMFMSAFAYCFFKSLLKQFINFVIGCFHCLQFSGDTFIRRMDTVKKKKKKDLISLSLLTFSKSKVSFVF
jgi:hypothetical protein